MKKRDLLKVLKIIIIIALIFVGATSVGYTNDDKISIEIVKIKQNNSDNWQTIKSIKNIKNNILPCLQNFLDNKYVLGIRNPKLRLRANTARILVCALDIYIGSPKQLQQNNYCYNFKVGLGQFGLVKEDRQIIKEIDKDFINFQKDLNNGYHYYLIIKINRKAKKIDVTNYYIDCLKEFEKEYFDFKNSI